MVAYKNLEISNERILRKGRRIRKVIDELRRKYDFDICGIPVIGVSDVREAERVRNHVERLLKNYKIPKDNLEVIVSFIDPNEVEHIVKLLYLAEMSGLRVDVSYKLKKMLIMFDPNSEKDLDSVLSIMGSGIPDVLAKRFGWNLKFYETISKNHVSVDKPCFRDLYFRKSSGYGFLRFNKHFAHIYNSKYHVAIDLGKVGDTIYRPTALDILLITHNHLDHIGSFIAKENEGLNPVIVSNLPTIELIYAKHLDYPVRKDLDDVLLRAYVKDVMNTGDMLVRSFLSGHAYGVMYYIEDYILGYTMLYTADINLSSKAFRWKNVRYLAGLEPDILTIEFPIFDKINGRIPSKGIIGTTNGEYEEFLARISDTKKVMVDKNSTVAIYEDVRRRYKSYLSRRVNKKRVDIGTIDDFFEGDYDYFITTKGNAHKYSQQYGVQTYVTNSPTNLPSVKTVHIKTHILYREAVDFISRINPKVLIIHHYNGNIKRVARFLDDIEKNSDVKEVYTTPPEGEPFELRKKL